MLTNRFPHLPNSRLIIKTLRGPSSQKHLFNVNPDLPYTGSEQEQEQE